MADTTKTPAIKNVGAGYPIPISTTTPKNDFFKPSEPNAIPTKSGYTTSEFYVAPTRFLNITYTETLQVSGQTLVVESINRTVDGINVNDLTNLYCNVWEIYLDDNPNPIMQLDCSGSVKHDPIFASNIYDSNVGFVIHIPFSKIRIRRNGGPGTGGGGIRVVAFANKTDIVFMR